MIVKILRKPEENDNFKCLFEKTNKDQNTQVYYLIKSLPKKKKTYSSPKNRNQKMIKVLLQINEPEQKIQQRITKASLSVFKHLKTNDNPKGWVKGKKNSRTQKMYQEYIIRTS